MDKKSNKPVGTIKVSESVIVKMAELARSTEFTAVVRLQLHRIPSQRCWVLFVQGWARILRRYALISS